MFTVADGLIWLRQSVQRNSMVRKMEIMKMRGQPTLPGLHTFRIGDAGIQVFPPASAAGACAARERTSPGAGPCCSMGVPRLDEMLGGGLPRGYSLLVAGPSGSGKSILAAAFLAEGARCGETGVIAAFEQRPNRSRNRAAGRPDRERPRRPGRQPGAGPVDRRDRDAADQRDPPAQRDPGGHRLALGLRAGAGADLPRRLPRVAAAPGRRAGDSRASPC